ncbi:hypothetical protein Fmac_008910 [Flemingia macrophylla]|uniref:Uncharacterized protein n=1 Tax=Flemingia macrophylla TaxID=520843 RepID=A0ABD1N163_9FABA
MAPQKDLVNIGLEGFDIIDRFYGAPNRRPKGRWGVQATQNHKEEPVLTSKEAASKFGGIMVMNCYPKTKPQNRWVITNSSFFQSNHVTSIVHKLAKSPSCLYNTLR